MSLKHSPQQVKAQREGGAIEMPFLCPTVNRFVLRLLAPSNNEFHSEDVREGLRRGRERVKCTKGEGEGKYHSPGLGIEIFMY